MEDAKSEWGGNM